MDTPSFIIGAGLAGLLAAHAWPTVPLIEAEPGPRPEHKALLRFRSDAVARLTGIEFRPVTVRKGIWSRGEFTKPTIALANAYSLKVVGRLAGDRSIWNTEPVTRYVAPEDFYLWLLDAVNPRIHWGETFDYNHPRDLPIISTAPLPIVIRSIIRKEPKEEFVRSPIQVRRYRVPCADLFQTVYFPDPELFVYRASMTGDLMIIEFADDSTTFEMDPELSAVGTAFGIDLAHCELLDKARQEYGKIVPLPDAQRKHLLFRLTAEHNIYSLGRFACWRNILLDDVVDDIAVIKRMLRSGSYEIAKVAAAETRR